MSTSCPATVHFRIYPHATFSETVTLRDSDGVLVNLTGASALMHIRREIDDTTPVFTLSSTGVTPAIVLGGALGTIAITLANTVTDDPVVDWDGEVWVHDILLTNSLGSVERTFQGTVTVLPGVTRPT